MSLLRQLAGNLCLVAPVSSWVLSQLLKFVLTALGTGKLNRERLWGSGGMPSAHAATVCALTTAIGITGGVGTGMFALAAIFSLIVMYDACGVRLEAGRHAKRLNELSGILGPVEGQPGAKPEPPFHEQVGHTLPQVFAGGALGIAMAVVFAAARGSL